MKSEIADQVTPSLNGLNRYRAEQLCIGVNSQHTLVTRADGGWDASTWARAACLVELSEEDVAPGSVVSLEISVSHQGEETVGSILIAAPSLELGDTR